MRQLIGAGTPREAVTGGYGGIFVLLTPTRTMLVARGVSQSGQTAFAAAFIHHLGVRAGKSHLINGLIRRSPAWSSQNGLPDRLQPRGGGGGPGTAANVTRDRKTFGCPVGGVGRQGCAGMRSS